jgi:hypothetical protein
MLLDCLQEQNNDEDGASAPTPPDLGDQRGIGLGQIMSKYYFNMAEALRFCSLVMIPKVTSQNVGMAVRDEKDVRMCAFEVAV